MDFWEYLNTPFKQLGWAHALLWGMLGGLTLGFLAAVVLWALI